MCVAAAGSMCMCSSCCWGRSTGGRLFAEADRWRRRARTEAALGRRRTKKSTHGVWACVSDECSGSSDGLLQRGRCVCLPVCGRACVCYTTVCSRSNNGADETSRSRSTKRRCGGGWGHRAGKARGENGVGGNGAAVDAVAGRVREWGGGSGGGGRGVLRSRGRGERLLALEGMVWSRGRLLSNVDDPVCVTGARPATSPSLLGRKPQTSWTWTWSRNGKTGPQLRF